MCVCVCVYTNSVYLHLLKYRYISILSYLNWRLTSKEDKQMAHKYTDSKWQSWVWIQKAWLQRLYAQLWIWDRSSYPSNKEDISFIQVLLSEFTQILPVTSFIVSIKKKKPSYLTFSLKNKMLLHFLINFKNFADFKHVDTAYQIFCSYLDAKLMWKMKTTW